ncbi:hypothetical protein [Sediminibacterium salmoneum]|uniref:hypothetical protein n=1 Tax=Sediminibacterium salmoneum TaxID=426421 RepID=UPI00047AADE7|nr:hypothetical protein [Sediminibacterium salmoneum]
MAEQLPDFVLAQLYPTSLVIVETEIAKPKPGLDQAVTKQMNQSVSAELKQEEIKTTGDSDKIPNLATTLTDEPLLPKQQLPLIERPDNWFLGKNAKRITILVNEPDAVFLNDANLDFLTKILGACKLNMGDVSVINTARYLALFPEIKKELSPSIYILFGVKTSDIQLPFIIPDYQIQPYDQSKFLAAPAFIQFTGDSAEAKLEKTKLWVSLKTLFNI